MEIDKGKYKRKNKRAIRSRSKIHKNTQHHKTHTRLRLSTYLEARTAGNRLAHTPSAVRNTDAVGAVSAGMMDDDRRAARLVGPAVVEAVAIEVVLPPAAVRLQPVRV
jgi:hypothetical protein